jgi:phosphate transport system substrate-binding protein
MIKHYIFLLLMPALLCSCFSKKKTYEAIRVRGSDSEVNLVQALAESYMDKDSGVSIGVTGGGSGAGIAGLINKKTDLANSSRAFTEEENYYAAKRLVHPFPIVFGLDAIAIIVHKDNPINTISLENISRIYSGKLAQWKGLGGNSSPVVTYGRQSSSGTYLYFRENVVKDEYVTNMIGMSGTAQIVEAVKSDRNSIGYVSSGYLSPDILKQVKVLKVKETEQAREYSPTEKASIEKSLYPIIRPLLQYTNGAPSGKLLQFIQYEMSDEGISIIEKNGFQRVSGKFLQQNPQLSVAAK